jgi:ribosome modulation factor
MTQLVNPFDVGSKLDRAAHEGYNAALAGQTVVPPEYAANDDLRFGWFVGNRRGRYDANNL